jgi:hypothetical protein
VSFFSSLKIHVFRSSASHPLLISRLILSCTSNSYFCDHNSLDAFRSFQTIIIFFICTDFVKLPLSPPNNCISLSSLSLFCCLFFRATLVLHFSSYLLYYFRIIFVRSLASRSSASQFTAFSFIPPSSPSFRSLFNLISFQFFDLHSHRHFSPKPLSLPDLFFGVQVGESFFGIHASPSHFELY